MADSTQAGPGLQQGPDQHPAEVPALWIVEARLDVPVRLPTHPSGASPNVIQISLGGFDADGFVELRPKDVGRSTGPTFWSADRPLEFDGRALVRAAGGINAFLRGSALYEHLADRLTLLLGYPIRVLAIGTVWNEDELRRCRDGFAKEYTVTTGGTEVWRIQPARNGQFQTLLYPPEAAFEAIRWFRQAQNSTRRIDQYLAYYISLESIARHVPGVTRQPRPNSSASPPELESQESAAIKHLLARRQLPSSSRSVLAAIRARIAHGATDVDTLSAATNNIPLIQRLALDGIALVYGLDPDALTTLAPNPIELMLPMCRGTYETDDPPSILRHGFLSDAFSEYCRTDEQMLQNNPTTEGTESG